MLYLFVCASEKCIQLGRAFAYRCLIPDTNEFVKFASDAEYEEINKQSDDTLAYTGKYGPWYEELEEEVEGEAQSAKDKIILEEFLIETDYEKGIITDKYIQHANRLHKARVNHGQKAQEDDDEDAARLELEYIERIHFGQGGKAQKQNE